jgi:hypothetical protein
MRLAAIHLALLLALFAAAGASAARSPIAWIDAPLPLWHLAPPRPIPNSTAAPVCKPSQLRVSRGRTGAATGHLLEEFNFANRSTTTCLLRGYPRVEATAPNGRRVTLHPSRGTFFGPLAAADIAPGGTTNLDFGTDDVCDGGMPKTTVYRNLVFILPSHARLGGGAVTLNKVCGLTISQFGLRPRYTTTYAPPGTLGTLSAHASVPKSVRRGTTLRFTVTLGNRTKRGVSFGAQCPGYTVGLYTQAAHSSRSYRLNCASVRRIAPGERASFAMRMRIPSNASLGLAKYGWNLDTEMGPFAGGTIEVER